MTRRDSFDLSRLKIDHDFSEQPVQPEFPEISLVISSANGLIVVGFIEELVLRNIRAVCKLPVLDDTRFFHWRTCEIPQ